MMPAPRAIILAAGRGERMRPLSDRTPKPLLEVQGRALIEWHLAALARAGVHDIVINTAWLEQRIVDQLGDGSRWGVRLHWSREGRDHGGALETAGGIATALPWLTAGPQDVFWVVSGDIFAPDFDFDARHLAAFDDPQRLGQLWLVANPPFHRSGDFGLDADGLGLADGCGPDGQRWTYANLALLRGALFAGIAAGTRAPLGPLLYAAMRERRIGAEVYRGRWENVGTPAQLEALNRSA